jgi:hypothetical protein
MTDRTEEGQPTRGSENFLCARAMHAKITASVLTRPVLSGESMFSSLYIIRARLRSCPSGVPKSQPQKVAQKDTGATAN